MIIQVINRVSDVRDLSEKRCEQLRRLSRTVQRFHPLPSEQNESLKFIGTTTTSVLQQQYLSPSDIDYNPSLSLNDESIIALHTKIDKKQR
jgi:hypothetical protein